jgi:hypothetical protein
VNSHQQLLTQLYAMRLLIDAAIGGLEQEVRTFEELAAASVGVEPELAQCPHRPERQVNATTMGGGAPLVFCLDCQKTRPGLLP